LVTPVMKRLLTPVPSRFARPIVTGLALSTQVIQ
jgi:hypothetical protein